MKNKFIPWAWLILTCFLLGVAVVLSDTKEQFFLVFAAFALSISGLYLLYGPGFRKSDLKFPWEE